MNKVIDFRDLRIWQEAFRLAVELHSATQRFPSHEMFGITSQLRRSSVSVAANIAEGMGRGRTGDFRRFLVIARGSLHESMNHVLMAKALSYMPAERADSIVKEYDGLSAGINALLSKLPTVRT